MIRAIVVMFVATFAVVHAAPKQPKLPVVKLLAAGTGPKHKLRLHAVAALTPGELWHALTARADPGEALKSLFDVRRVTARLWDGREIDVPLEGHGFSALIETGKTLAPGRYPIEVVAQDFAGNSSRQQIAVEVAP